MTKRDWKKKIYRGMAAELHHQAFGLGAKWLVLDGDGDPIQESEIIRMQTVASEIIESFLRLGRLRVNARRR